MASLVVRIQMLLISPCICLVKFYCWITQTIAAAIVVGVILHAGNHLACDFPRLERSSPQDYARYLSDFGTPKPTYGEIVRSIEGITGVIMVVLMAIAFVLATRYFRRGLIKLPKPFDRLTGYNAFWYSHHLLVIVYICLFIHGIKLYLVKKWYKMTVVFLWPFFHLRFLSFHSLLLFCINYLVICMIADMDVYRYSGFDLCRGKDSKILSIWIILCPSFEG